MKTPADLPFAHEKSYHLGITHVASRIMLVGDPDRAHMIGHRFLYVTEETMHRGLRTVHGTYKGVPISIITTGMGTPSAEIVCNEIVALHERAKGKQRQNFSVLKIVRLGTSGALQTHALGKGILTTHAIGLDNAGRYYRLKKVQSHLAKKVKTATGITSYIGTSSSSLRDALSRTAKKRGFSCKVGMTATCPGFFAAQARDISRLHLTYPLLDKMLVKIRFEGMHIENMEMETAFILAFFGSLGHDAASLCLAIADRRRNKMDTDYESHMKKAAQCVLDTLAKI